MHRSKAAFALFAGLGLALLAGAAFAASVGSLPTGVNVGNVFGLDDVCVPQLGTSYPDFAFCAAHFGYLVFGGNYDQLDWGDWQNSVKHYQLNVDDFSLWFGVWMAGWGDVNGDDDQDLLVGDTRHLNFDGDDWAD